LKLPRDLSLEFAKLLRRYGYEIERQKGSHLRLTSNALGSQHHITVPAHKPLKLGTLAGIVSSYWELERKFRPELV
jgi:predicted RNA binding protein YcfA (HicA-like mRNA interferase family)